MRHKACFCDYFLFVFGTLYYKCEIRLSACDEFINTDVYYFICTISVRFWFIVNIFMLITLVLFFICGNFLHSYVELNLSTARPWFCVDHHRNPWHITKHNRLASKPVIVLLEIHRIHDWHRYSNKSVLMLNGNGFYFGNLLEFCDVVTYPFPVHPSCQGIYLFW